MPKTKARQWVQTSLLCNCLLYSVLSSPLYSQPPAVLFDPVLQTGLNTPVDIVNAADNTNRLFIASQKDATIRVYDAAYNYLGTLLTVPDVRTAGGEEGLLSIAFHPDYETNRLFFAYYTNLNGDLELSRFETTLNPLVADPLSKTIIITIPHPGQENHNGGKLNFGTDGNLYFATGDGGGGGDPNNYAQSANSLLGKMLRINVNPGQATPYTIPVGNPFSSDPSVLPEIWAFGLRNPFRWSFDRVTGDVWIGDVGQSAWEEISFRAGPVINTGGINYQWRCFEGNNPYAGCTTTDGPGIDVPPVFNYPNPGVAAVTGGIVYRGTEYPTLAGTYIAADFYSGTVYQINNVSGSWITTPSTGFPDWIAGFGEAENGALYAVSLRGTVYKVTSAIATPVTIVAFSGQQDDKSVKLHWEVAEEEKVNRYEIEMSTNGTNYSTVGAVKATRRRLYDFSHSPANSPVLYYRLKSVDIDGTYIYSKIIDINFNNYDQKPFVKPSIISTGRFIVELDGNYVRLQVSSMDGKQVLDQNISGRTGQLQISLPSIPSGTYLVRLVGNKRVISQKIFVR